MRKRPHDLISELGRSMPTAIGIVLVWRGIWYVIDEVDLVFLKGNHALTAVGGIILGILLLYLPDRSLKEFEKL